MLKNIFLLDPQTQNYHFNTLMCYTKYHIGRKKNYALRQVSYVENCYDGYVVIFMVRETIV